MTTTRIEFEDHGQDFLRWTIDEDGKVMDSQPFQADLWNGTTLLDYPDLKVGMALAIITKHDDVLTLKYPIIKIERGE
jgi:hypothetical protein